MYLAAFDIEKNIYLENYQFMLQKQTMNLRIRKK